MVLSQSDTRYQIFRTCASWESSFSIHLYSSWTGKIETCCVENNPRYLRSQWEKERHYERWRSHFIQFPRNFVQTRKISPHKILQHSGIIFIFAPVPRWWRIFECVQKGGMTYMIKAFAKRFDFNDVRTSQPRTDVNSKQLQMPRGMVIYKYVY